MINSNLHKLYKIVDKMKMCVNLKFKNIKKIKEYLKYELFSGTYKIFLMNFLFRPPVFCF